jgi:hypothetical protein
MDGPGGGSPDGQKEKMADARTEERPIPGAGGRCQRALLSNGPARAAGASESAIAARQMKPKARTSKLASRRSVGKESSAGMVLKEEG